MKRAFAALALAAGSACFPTTTRPSFLPQPSAAVSEVELGIPEATRAIAAALDADSIPVRRTEMKDGWLESDWFDATTLQPTKRRPLGPDVVKVRAWVDPSRPSYSNITVETVFRPLADPSRSGRELEQQVPGDHPVAGRVAGVLSKLSNAFGGAAVDNSKLVKADSAATPAVKKP